MKKHIYSIDGLRVLFCMLIFVHHFWGGVTNYGQYGSAPLESILGPIYYNGALGVEFFFIVSGFMTAYNYKDRTNEISCKQFVFKRLCKLLPVATISTLIGFALSAINNNLQYNLTLVNKPVSIFHLVLSLLLVNNGWFVDSFNAYGSGTWFLNILMLCYLVWFILTKNIKNKKFYGAVLLFMVVLGAVCQRYNLNIPFLFSQSGRGYFNFFLGCILCDAYEKQQKYVLAGIPIVGIIIGVIDRNISYLFSLVLCPLLIYSVLYLKPVIKIMESKILKCLVPYTMCFYLSHVLVIASIIIGARYLNVYIDYSNLTVFVLIFLVCCLAAFILHKCVEIPIFKRLKNVKI